MANEKRLIPESERTNLIRCLKTLHDIDFTPGVYEHSVIGRAALLLEETADAVEVCRCKDCKHWLHVEQGFGDCTNPRFHLTGHADPTMNADNFCSCGERRENNA